MSAIKRNWICLTLSPPKEQSCRQNKDQRSLIHEIHNMPSEEPPLLFCPISFLKNSKWLACVVKHLTFPYFRYTEESHRNEHVCKWAEPRTLAVPGKCIWWFLDFHFPLIFSKKCFSISVFRMPIRSCNGTWGRLHFFWDIFGAKLFCCGLSLICKSHPVVWPASETPGEN